MVRRLIRKITGGSSKRKLTRIRSYHLMKILGKGGAAGESITNITNLSEGGVCFQTKREMKANSSFKFVLNIPGSKGVRGEGKVMWSRPGRGHRKGFTVGASFTQLLVKDSNIIQSIVKQAFRSKGKP